MAKSGYKDIFKLMSDPFKISGPSAKPLPDDTGTTAVSEAAVVADNSGKKEDLLGTSPVAPESPVSAAAPAPAASSTTTPAETAATSTPTKSSKTSIFGLKDKHKEKDKEKAEKNGANSSKMSAAGAAKPKTGDSFDCKYTHLSSPFALLDFALGQIVPCGPVWRQSQAEIYDVDSTKPIWRFAS